MQYFLFSSSWKQHVKRKNETDSTVGNRIGSKILRAKEVELEVKLDMNGAETETDSAGLNNTQIRQLSMGPRL
jgi:hypothetical protein